VATEPPQGVVPSMFAGVYDAVVRIVEVLILSERRW
jgi:hypothetical protein